MTGERWLPIVGYENYYQISDLGRVYALPRTVNYVDGRKRVESGHYLKPTRSSRRNGTRTVALTDMRGVRKGHKVSRLVLRAFVGPCPDGMESLHWDDDKDNNALSNLRWGTRSQNMLDKVRNGRHHKAILTHCHRGHEFTEANTKYNSRRHRSCRTCIRDCQRIRRAQKRKVSFRTEEKCRANLQRTPQRRRAA